MNINESMMLKQVALKMIVPVNFPNAMDVEDPKRCPVCSPGRSLNIGRYLKSNPAALDNNGIKDRIDQNGLKDINSFIPNVTKPFNMDLVKICIESPLTTGPCICHWNF